MAARLHVDVRVTVWTIFIFAIMLAHTARPNPDSSRAHGPEPADGRRPSWVAVGVARAVLLHAVGDRLVEHRREHPVGGEELSLSGPRDP